MSERRHAAPATEPQGVAVVDEQLRARSEWQRMLDSERTAAQHDAMRLDGLRGKEMSVALTDAEEDERLRIERRQASRSMRIENLERQVRVSVEEETYAELLATWPDTVTAKRQAWTDYFNVIAQLKPALDAVMAIHKQQEELWSQLPSYANGVPFVDEVSLRRNAGSRMLPNAGAWQILMDGFEYLSMPSLEAVLDVDTGCQYAETAFKGYVERRKREAANSRKGQV